MINKSDETIIYEAYQRLAKGIMNKNARIVTRKKDNVLLRGIMGKALLNLVYLEEMEQLTTAELQKHCMSSKGIYTQYCHISARNPEMVNDLLIKKMDQLIRAVSRHETDMIHDVSTKEMARDQISLKEVFAQKKYYNRLGSNLARDVFKSAVTDAATTVGKPDLSFYITKTGKKYHRTNCPYCKGRKLISSTSTMIANQKLTPCRCITEGMLTDEIDYSRVTAFIDESIHPVKWNIKGTAGQAGSFSYIICWGFLASEKDMTAERIIAQGIEHMNECEHIEHLTEAAIGKVMISLAYDYNFTGELKVFTDNMTAMEKWTESGSNSKLSKLFKAVTVCYIPREENTRADQLGRTRVFLDLPIAIYNEVTAKCNAYDKWHK